MWQEGAKQSLIPTDGKSWLIMRAEDLVRKLGDKEAPTSPVVFDARDRGRFVSTEPLRAVVASGLFERRTSSWVGYAFPLGRAGTRPYHNLSRVMDRLEQEAAAGLADQRAVDHDSWRGLFTQLGLQLEFSRLGRDVDPYIALREIVAARSGLGTAVFFLEDFRPATSIHLARAEDLARLARVGEPNERLPMIRDVPGTRMFVSTGAINRVAMTPGDERPLLYTVLPGGNYHSIACFRPTVQGPRLLTEAASLLAADPPVHATTWEHAFRELGLHDELDARPDGEGYYDCLRRLAREGKVQLHFLGDE